MTTVAEDTGTTGADAMRNMMMTGENETEIETVVTVTETATKIATATDDGATIANTKSMVTVTTTRSRTVPRPSSTKATGIIGPTGWENDYRYVVRTMACRSRFGQMCKTPRAGT
jgi:hypothetical protein